MKTFEGFLSFGNPNNKIVKDLIEYVENNDIEKYTKLDDYGIIKGFYFESGSKRDLESDPFGEEVGENDKKVELFWNPYEEYILTINGRGIRDCSQNLLKRLSDSIEKK